MSNDKLAEQLAKLKETLAKWEKELIVYSKWAVENDGILSDIENQVIQYIKTEILGIKDHIVKIEKAKGTDNGNPGKTFTADTKKAWNFNTFQSESEQVVVDKTKLTAGQIAYFETYEKVAQTYINRMSQIYEGKNNYAISEKKEPIHKLPIPLTGKMLADAALKTFVKYGNDISKVVPVELMLAQCQGESHFGTVIPRKGSAKSPFNVGVYDTKDAAFLDQVENMEEGVEMYYDLMAEDYLSARSADELDDNFVNENGLRYASSKDYEKMMKIIEDSVKSVIGKNGLTLPNTDDLANNNPAPIDNNDSTTHTNQDQNITRSITASVGVYGVNNMEDVKIIQKLLNEKINAGLIVDGYCGNFTETAIKAFQQKTFGWEDGLVEVGGRTAGKLFGGGSTASGGEGQQSSNLIDQAIEFGNNLYEKGKEFVGNALNSFIGTNQQATTKGTIEGEEAKKLFDNSLSLPKQNVGKNAPNLPDDVKFIQKLLGQPQTGKCDAQLEQKIMEFQAFIGLSTDAVIGTGQKTIISLISYQKALSELPNIPKEKGVAIQHPQPGSAFFSPFGMRKGFMVNGKFLNDHLHPGIDCGGGLNTPVYAVADGVVILSGVNGGYGNCIKIDHGKDESGKGFVTVYAHLNSCGVSNGTKVTKGILIGKEGSTGLSTASHLHFEVQVAGKAVDPMCYIKGAKLFPSQK
jgi:murein DD-endopeptidase MepM/ murein hydrolase activator NlpD